MCFGKAHSRLRRANLRCIRNSQTRLDLSRCHKFDGLVTARMDSTADDFVEPARPAVVLMQRNVAIRWFDKHLVLVDSFDFVVLNGDKLLMAMMQHSLAILEIDLAKCSEQLEMLETMSLGCCDG